VQQTTVVGLTNLDSDPRVRGKQFEFEDIRKWFLTNDPMGSEVSDNCSKAGPPDPPELL
jgi:hypothetical protein